MKPIFHHDCPHCIFLGTFECDKYGPHRIFDLYCHEKEMPTVLARYSSNCGDYYSGLTFSYPDTSAAIPMLVEARRRAIERGLLQAYREDKQRSENG